MSETTTYLKMDEQRKEYDEKAYRRDTIAMTIILILVAFTIAAAVILACAELHYIEYGRGIAYLGE
jgi:hypothetical protein